MFQNPSSKYRGGKPCDGGNSTLESKNPDDAAPYPSYENGIVVHKMGAKPQGKLQPYRHASQRILLSSLDVFPWRGIPIRMDDILNIVCQHCSLLRRRQKPLYVSKAMQSLALYVVNNGKTATGSERSQQL